MIRAAAYVRASTNLQIYSIKNQLSAIEAFCAANGMLVCEVFSDAGLSGLTMRRRPGLQALFNEAMKPTRSFDVVVVFDISRWGRFQDVDESAFYEQELRFAGVRIVYCGETFENNDSMSSAILKAVRRTMAAEYSRDLAGKITNGARRTVARGFRCGGTAGYGYRRAIFNPAGVAVSVAEFGEWKALSSHKTKLVLGPGEEVRAVKRIYSLYLAGDLNMREIASLMRAEGRPEPVPGGWRRLVVRGILSNEKYIGTTVWGQTTAPLATPRRHVPESEWVRTNNSHPQIVSRGVFDAVQRRIKRGRTWPKREILASLRKLFATYGTLTNAIISQSRTLPTLTHLRKQFGCIDGAISAAGLPYQSQGERRAITNSLQRQGIQTRDPRRWVKRPDGPKVPTEGKRTAPNRTRKDRA